MTRRLFSLLLFTLLSSAISAGEKSTYQSPLAVDGAETVTVTQAADLHAQGAAFVDVRNPRLYGKKHIPGAHHLDLKGGFEEQALKALVPVEKALVLYCSGAHCSRSSRASRLAIAWGYQQVKYFRDGVVGWKEAGLPLSWADGSTHPDPKYAK